MTKPLQANQVRSCKTNRGITIGSNVYNALIKAGYVQQVSEKTGEPVLDHPTKANKCHPRRQGKLSKKDRAAKTSQRKSAREARVASGEPMRPKNSFQMFSEDYLAQQRRALGAEAYEGVNKRQLVSQAWAASSQGVKDTYAARARQAMDAYKAELARFVGAGGKATPRARAGSRAKKVSPTRAAIAEAVGKKPVSGFLQFTIDNKESIRRDLGKMYGRDPKSFAVTDVSKAAKLMWDSATNAGVRAGYESRAKRLMEAYKAKKAQIAPMKKKGTPNSYILFTMDERAKLPAGLTIPQQGAELGARWKKVSPAKKAAYEQKAEGLKVAAGVVPKAKTPKKSPKKAKSPKKTPKKARTPKKSAKKKADASSLEGLMGLEMLASPRKASPKRASPRAALPLPSLSPMKQMSAKKLSPAQKAAVAQALAGRMSPQQLQEVVRASPELQALGGIQIPAGLADLDLPSVSPARGGVKRLYQ